MKTKVVASKIAKVIGPYSQGIKSGNFVFTSGQIYLKPDGKLLEGSVEEQTNQIMKNLAVILNTANVSFDDVVKTTIYTTSMANFGKINEVYKKYLSQPYPARETVGVSELPMGAKIEISMIAIK